MGCTHACSGVTAPVAGEELEVHQHSHCHGTRRKLDIRRDDEDHRDLKFHSVSHSKARGNKLPSAVDLRTSEPFPVYSEAAFDSSASSVLCAALHFEHWRQGRKDFCPSRLFVHFNADSEAKGVGISLREALRSFQQFGVCEEKAWPSMETAMSTRPSEAVYADASANRCIAYARVLQCLHSLKACLVAGYPFVFAMEAMCDFLAGEVETTGDMAWPPKGIPHGSATVQAVGYDDDKQCFIVRQSWGDAWGDQGYFRMPYDFIIHHQLCHDFWAIQFTSDAEFPAKPKEEAPASVESAAAAAASAGGA